MDTLKEKIANQFVITSELVPPKGTNLDVLLETARLLDGYVDAFNVTDSHAAHMSLSAIATAHTLIVEGFEPILQMVTRDRNRIAIQSDMLGASLLGITNLVCMGGDPPDVGDHPHAKPVFDLSTAELIGAASTLNSGYDEAGHKLSEPTDFHIGAVVNPGSSDLATEIRRMIHHLPVTIIAGVMPIKSVKMAQYANKKIPGIHIPEWMIQRIANADDVKEVSIQLAAELISELVPLCGGVHLMALGAEDRIPLILDRAMTYGNTINNCRYLNALTHKPICGFELLISDIQTTLSIGESNQ